MEDKIEVGEFVKFKDGSIDRIKNIVNTHSDRKLIAFEKRNSYLSDLGLKKQIVKHSEKIIKLIEEGDVLVLYDNEYEDTYKSEVFLDNENKHCVTNNEQNKILNLEEELFRGSIKIKEIVTKEQFESAAYKIEKQ